MEQFLTPKLEQEVSEISLEYIHEREIIFPDCPGFVKRNVISKSRNAHANILSGWMANDLISFDNNAWEYLKKSDILLAAIRFSELGDMIVHISKNELSPFNIMYCPEKMQEFQKFRTRIWWEYFEKNNKSYEFGYQSKGEEIWYLNESIDSFLEEQQILNDEYIRTLARKFYPEEYK